MSREIKFRVWDIQNERMVEDPYLFRPAMENEHGAAYEFFETWQDVDDGINRLCHVMQYTGLKGKNGAELYFDCDLCELDEHDGLWYATKDDFGIPCWIPEDGGFGVHIEFSTYFLNGTRRKDAFKIHGNRFENPELLS